MGGGGGSSISSGHKLHRAKNLDTSFVMQVLHFMNYSSVIRREKVDANADLKISSQERHKIQNFGPLRGKITIMHDCSIIM